MTSYALTATDIILRDDGASIPPDPNNRDYVAFLAWQAAGGVPDPYVPPEPEPFLAPPQVVAAALGMIVTPDIFDVSNPAGGTFNILGVGLYWLFFNTPQPDDDYYAIITSSALIAMTEHTSDYFAIEAKLDGPDGTPTDPAQFSVQILRIAT